MCLIGIVWRGHPRYSLVVAANRDEFHNRPAVPADTWPESPHVFGGRDLMQGGSWLAASTRNRFAAVTNVRRMAPPDPRAPSRGLLVAEFMEGDASAHQYAASLEKSALRYAGFNLLLYDGAELRFVCNHSQFEDRVVEPGVHVVSNASLDTPWPKSRRLHAALDAWTGNADSFEPLFAALADRTPAPDDQLPGTGLPPELERLLSAPFIVSPQYGTRCSTVVAIGADAADFVEKQFDAAGDLVGEVKTSLWLKGR